MNQITARIGKLSTSDIKEMAIAISQDLQDGAELVEAAILDELMQRMPEAEFVAFCEAL